MRRLVNRPKAGRCKCHRKIKIARPECAGGKINATQRSKQPLQQIQQILSVKMEGHSHRVEGTETFRAVSRLLETGKRKKVKG